jgi:hypothetical protein
MSGALDPLENPPIIECHLEAVTGGFPTALN